jgi:hypothetical protein
MEPKRSPDAPLRPDADAPARAGAKACPSSLCEEGALLLGVRTPSGYLAYLQPSTRIDAEFAERLKAQGHPERTYRFSAPCTEAECSQWTGHSCGLGEQVAAQASVLPAPSGGLPACAIRSSCRWYSEQGRAACAVCPLIVADTGGRGTWRTMAVEPEEDSPRARQDSNL